MASAIALVYYDLLVFVITLLVPAIAQVNTNVSVGSALFATDDNSKWTSPSGDFSFGFCRLLGQQDQFLLAIWFAKILDKTILNYQLSQKLKLLENGKFNHLTISLTLTLTCGLKLPLNKWEPNK